MCDALGAGGSIRNPPPPPVGRGVSPKDLFFLSAPDCFVWAWLVLLSETVPCLQNYTFVLFLQKSLELADLTQNPFTTSLGKSYLSLMPPAQGEGDDGDVLWPPTFWRSWEIQNLVERQSVSTVYLLRSQTIPLKKPSIGDFLWFQQLHHFTSFILHNFTVRSNHWVACWGSISPHLVFFP